MSAIFGLICFDGRPVVENDLTPMSAALAAYGRDRCGIWTSGHVGLGQRLMCFTPEDRLEQQPLAGPSGHHVLVADGRVDNRPELMEELGISILEAREMADSAFILRAYEKWGLDCVGHLVGSFVFALADSRQDCLLIVRSPMSRRSVFYHESPGRFAFASAPKGLFALPWIAHEIDRQSLANYLVAIPIESGKSLFSGLNRLPSGHMLVVRRTGVKATCYWRPDLRPELRFSRDSDYVEAFNELFERVVGDFMRSLTPVGVMMSGGLDSSAVGAVAAALLAGNKKRLAVFTEIPPAGLEPTVLAGRYADETPFVRAIAGKSGNMDVNFISDSGFFLDDIDQFFDAAETPFRAAWNRMWYETIVCQASARNCRVVLTGSPGNLTISWDGKGLLPQLLGSGNWVRAFKEARASAANGSQSILRTLARGVLPLLPDPLWRGLRYLRNLHQGDEQPDTPNPVWRRYSVIHPEFARFHRVDELAREVRYGAHARSGSSTRTERYEKLQHREIGVDVGRGDEARFGLQLRDPAGDSRIVDFCLAVPEGQYQREGVSRSLIRRAMVDRLPSEVLANRQRGVQAADWHDRLLQARSRIDDEISLLDTSELARQAIDLKRLRKLSGRVPLTTDGKKDGLLAYREILGSGLMTGTFIRWFQSSTSRRESV